MPRKNRDRPQIPLPYDLSQDGKRTEVLYICPVCRVDLRLLGNKQNYCFRCGQRLDWEFCLKEVTESISNIYWGYGDEYYSGKCGYDEMKRNQNYIIEEIYNLACEGRKFSKGY